MGWMYYDDRDMKTKQDYVDILNEINAYRELDGQDFDFGTGVIINEMCLGSEDAYYGMDIRLLEDIIEYWNNYSKPKPKTKKRKNNYINNRKHKNKLQSMVNNHWFPVYNCEEKYAKRFYRGGGSPFLKKMSNRKIRRYKGDFEPKGNKFHRVYDFWWELY